MRRRIFWISVGFSVGVGVGGFCLGLLGFYGSAATFMGLGFLSSMAALIFGEM